jgi:hypothetical protein
MPYSLSASNSHILTHATRGIGAPERQAARVMKLAACTFRRPFAVGCLRVSRSQDLKVQRSQSPAVPRLAGRALTAPPRDLPGTMPAWTLHHCPSSGKSYIMSLFALGNTTKPLRPHQQEALDFIGSPACRGHVLFVFSSLVVLRDFEAELLSDVGVELQPGDPRPTSAAARVRVCGEDSWDPRGLCELLRRRSTPAILLTTYQSSWKVDDALRLAKTVRLSAACFDEAHNVHTPERRHLWADVAWLERAYPRRLYATGTPRREMELNPRIYGDKSTRWHRVSYARLLKEQDPVRPAVKPFDVAIALQRECDEAGDREFLDWVSILRQASLDGARRVKVYNKRAREDPRAAADFARAWGRAHQYLRERGEWRGDWPLEVKSADGTMHWQALKKIKDWFNEPQGDDEEDDDSVRVLCSCQVFAEGVTLERVDLTVFADRKRSARDIVQSGMRSTQLVHDFPHHWVMVGAIFTSCGDLETEVHRTFVEFRLPMPRWRSGRVVGQSQEVYDLGWCGDAQDIVRLVTKRLEEMRERSSKKFRRESDASSLSLLIEVERTKQAEAQVRKAEADAAKAAADAAKANADARCLEALRDILRQATSKQVPQITWI